MSSAGQAPQQEEEYAYLKVPPSEELRPCVGLVLAGMAARAKIGVGSLEEAVELLEGLHSDHAPTRFRFSLGGGGVVAEVEEAGGEPDAGADAGASAGASAGSRWRTVVELVS